MITPKQLKQLAEAIYPDTSFTIDEDNVVWFDEYDEIIGHTGRVFNPVDIYAQAMVVLVWIIEKRNKVQEGVEFYKFNDLFEITSGYHQRHEEWDICESGDTLSKTIVRAAIKILELDK